jgi:hypothetical protein
MGGMLKQALEMKQHIEELKDKLGEEQFEVTSGGGMVTVLISGKMEIRSIRIDPEIIHKDEQEMLETMVRAAINEAIARVRERMEGAMREIAGGLDIPGLV